MPRQQSLDDQENALVIRLQEVNRQIAELEVERSVLIKHIDLVRKSNLKLGDVKRSDSVNRAIAENEIVMFLKSRSKKSKTSDIIEHVRTVLSNSKAVTIRSYLKRMEDRELIRSAGHGYWTIYRA